MKSYKKTTKNPLTRLPDALRQELASYVTKNQPSTPHLTMVSDVHQNSGELSPREQVFQFAHAAANKFKLPNDIKNYLDKAAAARLRKHGFKRALRFIESRSEAAFAALSVLPESWWKVDTEFKRLRLADELTGRARLRLELSATNGFSALESISLINEYVGAALWMPQFSHAEDEDQAYSILVRLIDDSVWKRAIDRQVVAAFENARRAAGMVSPHVSPYASYSACEWLKMREDRQREWLELMAIESENGDVVNMYDVHQSSVSNPVNRRNELMTRIAGCQEYADANNHLAVFVTMTAAGKYHRLKKQGKYWGENPNWNGASSQAAHQWLKTSWDRFRSAADRKGVTYYGMRVVEPHVDGTPHWHGVFFMPLEHYGVFKTLLEHYQWQRDSDELFFPDGAPKTKAMTARVKVELVDREKGDAVSYIAKYISKNIDGHGLEGLTDLDAKQVILKNTVRNVTAFARAFSFRQFQFQKTPSVSVWRELRRIEEKQEYCLFEKARRAADMGFFSAYFDYMGGHHLPESLRPIKLHREPTENKYGEQTTKIIGVEGSGLTVLTREVQWKLIQKPSSSEALNALDPALPWTSGNNCTQDSRPTKSQRTISNFFLFEELDRDHNEFFST